MIELTNYIHYLLLGNDCVIVPGLGGFIAHYEPARHDPAAQVYYPPSRTIAFNSKLTLNDGLLAQAYMATYHTDFPDACRRIAKEVDQLKAALHRTGVVDLQGIGTLHYTAAGQYDFTRHAMGPVSPMLYGLEMIELHPLPLPQLRQKSLRTTFTPERKARIVRMSKQWAGNVAAVAAAVLLFFCISTPAENTYIDRGAYASLGTADLFETISHHSLATRVIALPQQPVKKKQQAVRPVTVKTVKVPKTQTNDTPMMVKAPEATRSNAIAPAQRPAQPAQAVKKDNYAIIVASLATAADAQKALKQLNAKGYPNARVVEGAGRYRIALYDFENEADAYKKINDLRQQPEFAAAWVLHQQNKK